MYGKTSQWEAFFISTCITHHSWEQPIRLRTEKTHTQFTSPTLGCSCYKLTRSLKSVPVWLTQTSEKRHRRHNKASANIGVRFQTPWPSAIWHWHASLTSTTCWLFALDGCIKGSAAVKKRFLLVMKCQWMFCLWCERFWKWSQLD